MDYYKSKDNEFKSPLYLRVEKNFGITPETIARFNLIIQKHNIKIWQLYFKQEQTKVLDPNFIPKPCTQPDRKLNPYHENNDIINIYFTEEWKDADFIGILSWRFFEKTKLRMDNIINQIENDCDIYTLTPATSAYMGQKHHYRQNFPGQGMDYICKLVDDAGILPIQCVDYAKYTSWCNYWLLTPEYFKQYLEQYLIPLFDFFKYNDRAKKMFEFTTMHRGEPYPTVVFFFEGLFALFLHDKKFKHIK
jgi:hypothetical protein